MAEEVQCEEIMIPVPWGHIAGKWWGPQNIRPILFTHGWQDNCGSFDRLIPLLPKEFSYIAIDYPGHGLSSQHPKGMFYYEMDTVFWIRRIMQHFGWKKVSLLGHSSGAMNNFIYSMLFPDTVEFLICLDSLRPLFTTESKYTFDVAKNCALFLKYDALNNSTEEPPCYSGNELAQKVHEGSDGSIALDVCHFMVKRSVFRSEKDPKKFCFNRDPRLKTRLLYYWTADYVNEYTKKITCPLFVCSMRPSTFFHEDYFKVTCDIIDKSNGGRLEFHCVDGTHHGHLNNPENLAVLISDFIKRYRVPDYNFQLIFGWSETFNKNTILLESFGYDRMSDTNLSSEGFIYILGH